MPTLFSSRRRFGWIYWLAGMNNDRDCLWLIFTIAAFGIGMLVIAFLFGRWAERGYRW